MSLILSWSLANYFEFCQLVLPPLRSLLLLRPPREGEKLLLVSRDIEVRHFSLFCKIYIRYTSCSALKIMLIGTQFWLGFSAFLPCIPLNGLGASSSGYFLNLGVGLIVLVTIFSWFTCLSVPIHGAFPYSSSSRNIKIEFKNDTFWKHHICILLKW